MYMVEWLGPQSLTWKDLGSIPGRRCMVLLSKVLTLALPLAHILGLFSNSPLTMQEKNAFKINVSSMLYISTIH